MIKLILLLNADDMVIISESESENGLQNRLDLLDAYCKTKIMIFTKGGRITRNLHFMYQGCETEIVNNLP